MRKRNTADNKTDGGVRAASSTAEKAEKYVEALATRAPENVKPYLVKAAPFVRKALEFMESVLIPFLMKSYQKYLELAEKAKPYRLDLLTPAFFGLVLCFFGGSYLTLIAAIEAYRLSAWSSTYEALKSLYNDLEKCIEADQKDNADKTDKDANGVADVVELSGEDLIKRKVVLFAQTVDPKKVTTALVAIQAGAMSVVATLKLTFAQAITLGSSIGEVVDRPAQRYLTPLLSDALPPEFKKWASPVVSYSVRSSCVSLAWFLQRVISAAHSAIRGGHMVARNILQYLSAMQIYHLDDKDTNLDEICGYGASYQSFSPSLFPDTDTFRTTSLGAVLAAVGLYFQLSWGFRLPFLLSLLLFPFSIAEYFLMWVVNVK